MNSIVKGTPVDLLIEKFVGWLQEQPEYVQVLQMPRQQRRAAQRALADRLFQHITFSGGDDANNRKRRRGSERIRKDTEVKAQRQEEARQRRIKRAMETLLKDGALQAAAPGVSLEDAAVTPVEGDPNLAITDVDLPTFVPDAEDEETNELMFVETDETADAVESETTEEVNDEVEAEDGAVRPGEE